jgi:hypothetical protein
MTPLWYWSKLYCECEVNELLSACSRMGGGGGKGGKSYSAARVATLEEMRVGIGEVGDVLSACSRLEEGEGNGRGENSYNTLKGRVGLGESDGWDIKG